MYLMYDALVLAEFYTDENGQLKLRLMKNIKSTWLPYIFELAYNKDMDLTDILEGWKKERVFPKNRYGSKQLLKELGLKKYDVDKIAELTRCSLTNDPYWLAISEDDTFTKCSAKTDKREYNQLGLKEEDYVWKK